MTTSLASTCKSELKQLPRTERGSFLESHMKETGLMFKTPLVRGILDDLKTQTRRIAKLPHMNPLGEWEPTTVGGPGGGRTRDGKEIPLQVALAHTRTGDVICAPYQQGDRIYVRESFARVPTVCGGDELVFAADYQDGSDKAAGVKYTPAIHMPKAAARIWLEVTGVRVERLQDISESDTQAEGCSIECMTPTGDDNGSAIHGPGGFAALWDSTTDRPSLPANENSKRYARVKQWLDTHPDTASWAANPWVWVIDFKRIEKP